LPLVGRNSEREGERGEEGRREGKGKRKGKGKGKKNKHSRLVNV